MATLRAYTQFNINSIDLNFYVRNFYDSTLVKNANQTIEGVRYKDVFVVETWDAPALAFGGTGFSQDRWGKITGGTVTGVVEFDSYTGATYWTAQGISISAKALYAAAQTRSNSDELKLITKAFAGSDKFYLSDESDIAKGFDGNDQLYGYAGDDRLEGGNGNDRIFGGEDNDSISGGSGNDALYGEAGNDSISGSSGNDKLYGGEGDDLLYGGAGTDQLSGGSGSDYFVFKSVADIGKGSKRDVISDFEVGTDKVDLSAIDASTKTSGNQSFIFIDSASFSGLAGQIRFVNGVLSGDTNGDKVADFQIQFTNVISLSSTDFVL
jgi:Ca2+-binding RTX toxin-like protein